MGGLNPVLARYGEDVTCYWQWKWHETRGARTPWRLLTPKAGVSLDAGF